jgi:1-acyl-sn-glycerol-3-phosphate acyltransferase
MRTVACICVYAAAVAALTPLILVCVLFGLDGLLGAAGKAALRLGRPILGLRIEVAGIDRIRPGTPCVFMANHESFLDGPILFAVIPGLVRVILKKEVFRIPVVGPGMRSVGFVPVDRKGARGGPQSIERAARLMAGRGYSYLVFPEGTRSRDGRLQPFRRGGFFLALAGGAPIVPVTIRGTFALMPRGRFFVRPGLVRVEFHAPVAVEGHTVQGMARLMDGIRGVIASALGEVAQ